MALSYKDFEAGPGSDRPGYWWARRDGALHNVLWQAKNFLALQQSYRTAENLRHARLYGGQELIGLGLGTYMKSSAAYGGARIGLNVVQAVVDTIAAKIAKNRPRPFFLTSGGDWEKQRRARLLNKFCQGAFYEAEVYEHTSRIFTDACIFGTGVGKTFDDEGRIRFERIVPEELLIDDAEGIHGNPRQVIQRKAMPREVLIDLYGRTPKLRDEIARAKKPEDNLAGRDYGDMLEVLEAWHLPSGRAAKDGRHVLSVSTVQLNEGDDSWDKQHFPFSFIRWAPRIVGFWGQGISERLTGIQVEINRLIKEIAETMRMVSKGRVFIENSSKIVKSHINNDVGTIVTFTGSPPIISNANAVPPELREHLMFLYQKAFEEIGVSQLSATMRKPAGLDSGRALREYNDIETERFIVVGQSYERIHLDIAKKMISLARDLSEKEGYKVKVPGKRFVDEIDWKDIDLEEDAYVLQVFPVSSLPTTPAAKMQAVQELIQAGFVDPVEGRRLLDMPDLESSTSLATAALDDVDASIEAILERGEYMPPEEFQNLELLLTRAKSAYLKARHDGAPEERLELMQTLISQTADLLIRASQPPPQSALPPGPPQPAGPIPAGPPAPGLPQ